MGEFVEADREKLEWVEEIVEDRNVPEDDDSNGVDAGYYNGCALILGWVDA